MYDAIRWILAKDRHIVDMMFRSLQLNCLSDRQWKILVEFVKVLKPVADAITYIEAERNMYMGHLLPTVMAVWVSLGKLSDLKYLLPLCHYLKDQLTSRFQSVFDDDFYKLAAAFHPERRLKWCVNEDGTPNHELASNCRELMIITLEGMSPNLSDIEEDESNADESSETNLFDVLLSDKEPSQMSSRDCVNAFLGDCKSKLAPLDSSTLLKSAFIKFNTGLPSSAPVERLFSAGKDILRPKRSSMSDTNFDKAMFLRGNRNLKL